VPDLVSALAREAKEAILDLHVRKVILERTKHNGNLPSGFMAEIVSSLEKQGRAKARQEVRTCLVEEPQLEKKEKMIMYEASKVLFVT
jgi:hypothetical protein